MRLARIVAIVTLPALAACHAVRYDTGVAPSPRRYERTVQFFLWGLVPPRGATVDLDEACPEGVARWEEKATLGDALGDVLTLGLWSPRTVIVECAEVRR